MSTNFGGIGPTCAPRSTKVARRGHKSTDFTRTWSDSSRCWPNLAPTWTLSAKCGRIWGPKLDHIAQTWLVSANLNRRTNIFFAQHAGPTNMLTGAVATYESSPLAILHRPAPRNSGRSPSRPPGQPPEGAQAERGVVATGDAVKPHRARRKANVATRRLPVPMCGGGERDSRETGTSGVRPEVVTTNGGTTPQTRQRPTRHALRGGHSEGHGPKFSRDPGRQRAMKRGVFKTGSLLTLGEPS